MALSANQSAAWNQFETPSEQFRGRISVDKLSLQSSTIPDGHLSPIELGRVIL